MSQTVEIVSNLRPIIFGLKVRTRGPQPSICVRTFSLFTRSLPHVPHQLCHYHYLDEAAGPVFEADRHAKTELKKLVRGVRPIERALEGGEDEQRDAMRSYCLAVRSALTDDGRPPLCASGLKLHDRLTQIADSLARVEAKKGAFTRL